MKITNSITEYIEKNQSRKNVVWKYWDKKLFFHAGLGIWQHEQSFDNFFPQYDYVKLNHKGVNQDKTKIR